MSNYESSWLFDEDIQAISAGKPLVLPERLLDILIFLEERRKQEEEKQRQIREEASASEWAEMQKRFADAKAKEKEERSNASCKTWGLTRTN